MISLGRSSVPFNEERVRWAASSSESGQFIRQWPNQFGQMLGKEFTEGIEPSGGQWQKLALARALYREPKVLILDEPTAAVDAESETRIVRRLSQSTEQTVILIAHRFSVLRSSDRICVMEAGSVKEVGTHEELLDSPGTYARLFNMQAAAYQ